MTLTPIAERACPKVNLTLRVLGRRADGYHELDSLVVFARDAADIVTLTLGSAIGCETSGPFAGSIAGQNLIAVTLDRIGHWAPHLELGAVRLEKNLPIAAGIGGGSADAAAVIRAVKRANSRDAIASLDWDELAVSLGADVPVCIASVAQRMMGRGDELSLLPGLPTLAIVLANPVSPVPADKTAQVFRALQTAPVQRSAGDVALPIGIADREALITHMRLVGNDLLAAARCVVPRIDDVLGALEATPGCRLVQLSGGGPTCFGVFEDWPSAQVGASHLASRHPEWWVCASRTS